MKRLIVLVFVLACTAFANTIITPDDFGGPYCLSPAGGSAACSLSSEYKDGGLVFSWGVGTAVFSDPPDAWGGINDSGGVDLVSPVNGWLVLPGTLTPGLVDYISVEAGYAADQTLTLAVYDINGNLLATRLNGSDGDGPHGRTLITLSGIQGIHYFSVYGDDTFGVDQIELGEITPAGQIPEPATFLLLGGGLAAVLFLRRRHA